MSVKHDSGKNQIWMQEISGEKVAEKNNKQMVPKYLSITV